MRWLAILPLLFVLGPTAAAPYRAGELLVTFEPDVRRQDTARKLGAMDVEPVTPELSRVTLPPETPVAQALRHFSADPAVRHAQPNYLYRISAIPNDPGFALQWALANIGQTIEDAPYPTSNPPGFADADLDLPTAWDTVTDCRPVVVAVLDTGVNYAHEDLAANMWQHPDLPAPGFDLFDDDPDPIEPGDGHGTHVAGIIGAAGNNNRGISGVCWQARLMALRVVGPNGMGSTIDLVRGIRFAVDHGASILNMSLGGEHPPDRAQAQAIAYAAAHDVLVITAAGNEGVDLDIGGADGDPATLHQPCAIDAENLLCVTALDQAFLRAEFANVGAGSVDVGAPGTNILSSYPGPVLFTDFTGWQLGDGWDVVDNCLPGNGAGRLLANPSQWCHPAARYDAGADQRAWRSFDLATTPPAAGSRPILGARLEYLLDADLASGDRLSVAYAAAGGDPFVAGTTLRVVTGNTTEVQFADVSDCTTSDCAIGFRLQSGAAPTAHGVAVGNLAFLTATEGATRYVLMNGTSMAAPHAAGVAALLRAFNPRYSALDTAAAITGGGTPVDSLAAVTRSGRALNALGSLYWLPPPQGVSVIRN